MNEELRNRNNELSDAALEQVSGGYSEEDVQKVCATCLSRRYPSRYSCTFDGRNWLKLYDEMYNHSVLAPGNHTEFCPYLKKP